MMEPSPTLLIAAASSFVGLAVDEREGELSDDGTAFLYRCGYWSHFDHASGTTSWPLIETRTADELAAVAMVRYVLRDAPQVGDIFLQHSQRAKRFVRAGVIAEVCGSGRYSQKIGYHDATTIEAGSDSAGQFRGRHILRVARRFLPSRGDRFIRWAELDDNVDADGREAMARILARVLPGGEIRRTHGVSGTAIPLDIARELQEAA
jgi:hypothetical protein